MFEDLETTAGLAYALVASVLALIGWVKRFRERAKNDQLEPAFDETNDFMAAGHVVLEAADLLAKHVWPDSPTANLTHSMKRKSEALMIALSAEAPKLNQLVQESSDSLRRVMQEMREQGASDAEVLEDLLSPQSDLLRRAVAISRERRRAKMLGEGAPRK